MRNICVFLVFIISIIVFKPNKINACRIDRAFEALIIYDYFKAKKLFYKSYKALPSPSAYGLSIIYYRKDNPFHHLDSALNYIQIAEIEIENINEKKKEKLLEFGYSLKSIKNLKQKISFDYYQIAYSYKNPDSLDLFISEHPWSDYVGDAVKKRDSIAFEIARKKNKSEFYLSYQKKYPKSLFNEKANELFHLTQYEEYTNDNSLKSYELFLKDCQESPYKIDAENRIYEIITRNQTLESFENIVNKYPENINVNEAWKKLYKLFMEEFSEKRFDEFKLKYPHYPYIEDLEKDYALSILKLFPFVNNGKWGYINKTGKIEIKAIYDEIGFFSEGLAAARLDEKYGFISKSNESVIPFNYDGVYDFESNRALIEKDDKMGMIDRIGSYILHPIYEDIGSLNENKFFFLKDSLYGYMDINGKIIIQEKFEEAFSFENGVAKVFINDKQAIINSNGDYLFPPLFNRVKKFSDSLYLVKEDNLWGIAKPNGNLILPCSYDNIGELKNNRAFITSNQKIGFIDKSGKVIISLKYNAPYNYQEVCNFHLGLATVLKNGKYGMIDTLGNIKIKFTYKQLGKSSELIAYKKNNLWGYIRPNGKKILSPKYDYAESTQNGIAIVQNDTLMGMINNSAKYIIPLAYKNISELSSSHYLIESGGLYGIINKEGKHLLPLEYKEISPITSNYIKVKKEDEVLYFNLLENKFIKVKK